VAGSTTLGVTVSETTQVATGWSVKKSILGRNVYNETGAKVGKVEDLIITPEKHVSYVIVGAGGFIGMGRHDVAIPVSQITNQGGKIVMPGATKDAIKALPEFEYSSDTGRQARFVAKAEQELSSARKHLGEAQRHAASASADMKVKADAEVLVVQQDLKAAEDLLSQMKLAGAARWKEFEAGVSAAMARLHKSAEAANKG
jgi:sporulation protein YlmC with PRC-barrel domain